MNAANTRLDPALTAPTAEVLPTSPSAPPPSSTSRAAIIDERPVIQQVLGRYAAAFTRLDASAAAAVWPEVNRRALERGFSQLESQTISFRDCNVLVRASQASAQCRGEARYVPKVGNRNERSESRTWRFELQKTGERWIIAAVESR
jgi:hypothetical protein